MIVQVFPEHENAGKRILPPLMTFPCVLDEAATSEMRMLLVVPWNRVTVILYCPPSAQSVSVIVNTGCLSP